jgi:hypothetical protein
MLLARRTMKLSPLAAALTTTLILSFTGCWHIGPGTIMEDRIPYNEAIVSTWKQQTLLNIVRLRYAEFPEWVDVTSVVNGYEHSRETNLSIGTELYPNDTTSNFLAPQIGGTRAIVDRPTITYVPQSDSEFTRNLILPIPPISILNLIESGNPADVVLDLAVESINGVRNRGYSGSYQEGDIEFQQIVQIIQKAQNSGHISLRMVAKPGETNPDVVMAIRSDNISPELRAELDLLRQILNLDPNVREFKVVFGMLPETKDEIAIRSRSVLRIMAYLALNVQVPQCHLVEGLAPDFGVMDSGPESQLTVHSGSERPCNSYSAIYHHGYWFWIDQRDHVSKRTMAYLKILLALANTGRKDASPALTIRAN